MFGILKGKVMENDIKIKQLNLNEATKWRSQIDWTEKDIVIAKKFSKSRELIRQIRKSHNLPSSATISRKEPFFKVKLEFVDWNKPNSEIAKDKNVCYTTVANQRKVWAPQTVKKQGGAREIYQNIDWSKKQKEIQSFLWENHGIKTCQTNISRYKRIFAPDLVQKKEKRTVAA